MSDYYLLSGGAPTIRRTLHRADMLTLEDADGVRMWPTLYAGYDAAMRQRVRDAAKRLGQTHVYLGAVQEREHHLPRGHPQFDYLDKPAVMAQACEEIHRGGLWPYLILGMEDAKAAQRKYSQPDDFATRIRRIVEACHEWVAGVCIGVELPEWTDESYSHIYARAVHGIDSTIEVAAHFSKRDWGWPGHTRAFWREARRKDGHLYSFDLLNNQYGFDFYERRNHDLVGLMQSTIDRQDFLDDLDAGFRGFEYALDDPWPEAGQAIDALTTTGYGNG